jgi:5-methylcytosine-specific restriction endonuclease McrA
MTQAIRPSSIVCARCGVEKKVGRAGPIPTYCSGACRRSLSYEKSREDGRYAKALADARQRTIERRNTEARPCPYCGTAMKHPRRVQCGSLECKRAFNADRIREYSRAYKARTGHWPHHAYADSKRAYEKWRRQERAHWRKLYPELAATYDARRRALVEQAQTDETFAPIDVHKRDDWTCKICLRPIDPEIAWPDPMSPSIDHVVPLSRGGAHALSNVQSAHLGCNSSKGDRLMGDAVAVLTRLAGQA